MRFFIVFLFLVGCSHPKRVFPTQIEIDALTATPFKSVDIGKNELDVMEWELKGFIPEEWKRIEHEAVSPFEKALHSHLKATQSRVAENNAMHCLAREMGQFQLANKALPSLPLRRFMMGACGAFVSDFQVRVLSTDVKEGISNEQLLANWKPPMARHFKEIPSEGVAGLWFMRQFNQALWILVWGQEEVQLEPFSRKPNAEGAIMLRGRFLGHVERATFEITKEEWGFTDCSASKRPLPEFEVVCPIGASEWISAYRKDANTRMPRHSFDVIAWPASGKFRYHQRALPEAKTATAPFEERVVEILNEIRLKSSVPKLSYSVDQSHESSRLAPHYFAEDNNRFLKTTGYSSRDLAIQSLIAGWKLKEPILSGVLISSESAAPEDSSLLVQNLLLDAWGRRMLLDASKSIIAIGLHRATGLGAVVTLYETPKPFMQDTVVEKIVSELNRERAKKGLKPAEKVEAPPGLDGEVTFMMESEKQTPDVILKAYESKISDFTGKSAHGWVVRKTDLEKIPFPKALLSEKSVGLIATVAYYKSPDEPWVSWLMYLVSTPVSNAPSN